MIKKRYILIIIPLLLIIFFFVNRRNNYLNIEKIMNDIGNKIESILIIKNDLVKEDILNGLNTNLEKENNELKKTLNLNTSDYSYINSNVIKREDWYQEIIIDKGSNSNIRENLAVVADDKLIGKVEKVNYKTSTVELLTSNKLSISVIIGDNSCHGIIKEYKDNKLIIEGISKECNIEINDNIYTSGFSTYPEGIYIGKIFNYENDKLELSKIAYVSYNIDNINIVSIIDRK